MGSGPPFVILRCQKNFQDGAGDPRRKKRGAKAGRKNTLQRLLLFAIRNKFNGKMNLTETVVNLELDWGRT